MRRAAPCPRIRPGDSTRPGRTAARLLALASLTAAMQAGAQPAIPPRPPATAPSSAPAPSAGGQPSAGPAQPAAPSPGPAALGPLLRQARADLDRGAPDEAFQRLSAQVQWYAGLPEFDYLLGLSALDAGRPGQAVLALERVLTVEPGHLQARAELARALLAIREREASRREFQAVAASGIPPEVRRIIDNYLARIAAIDRDGESGRRIQGYAEVGTGWDSNVNLGSVSGQWLLANGISVIPEATSRARSSATATAGAGLTWHQPIGGAWELTAGAQVLHRSNPHAHTLDQTLLDVSGGLEYRSNCNTITMLAQLQHLRVDDSAFRNASGGLAQWRCEITPRVQVGAYVQHFDLRFPDQGIRDARRDIVGGTLARSFDGASEPVLVASVYVGNERPKADVPQLKYRFVGVRAVFSAEIAAKTRAWAALSWEDRDFSGEEPLFGVVRADRQTEIRVGVDRAIGQDWIVTPQIGYTRNVSTLAPNDFRRGQAQLTARYRF